MSLADKVNQAIAPQVAAMQSNLQTFIANTSANNATSYVGQVDVGSFVYGAGASSTLDTAGGTTSGGTSVAAFTGTRFLRPGDIAANVGGRIF